MSDPLAEYKVSVRFDREASVWRVEGSNVPGLNAEASTIPELEKIIADLAPALIEANGQR